MTILDIDDTIQADSLRPVYPDWVKKVVNTELEIAGHSFDLSKLGSYFFGQQGTTGWKTGAEVYKHLEESCLLQNCLGIGELTAIKEKRNVAFYRKYFGGEFLFGWRSVVDRGAIGDFDHRYVPFLWLDSEPIYWAHRREGYFLRLSWHPLYRPVYGSSPVRLLTN